MDTKTVNYPKRAHEERHGRLVALHIHNERNSRPDSPHLQLFLSGHEPLFLQGAREAQKHKPPLNRIHILRRFLSCQKRFYYNIYNLLNALIR